MFVHIKYMLYLCSIIIKQTTIIKNYSYEDLQKKFKRNE